MNITIISSDEDIASMTMRNQLLSAYAFKKQTDLGPWNPKIVTARYFYDPPETQGTLRFTLIIIQISKIHLDDYLAPHELYGDLLIFASRHRSEANRPALLCHTSGNLSDDISAGGKPFQVAKGSGVVLYYLYTFLQRYAEERHCEFPIDQEVTHHGPTTFSAPMAFVELGSTETEWKNETGAKIVVDAIIHTGVEIALKHFRDGKIFPDPIKVCIGIGGTHYMPNFTRCIAHGYSFVHTIPKYKIMAINSDMIQHLQERSLEPITAWVVDWKGLNSAEKNHILPLLEASKIPILKSKDI